MSVHAIITTKLTWQSLADQSVTNENPVEQANVPTIRFIVFISLQQFSNYRLHGAILPKSCVISEAPFTKHFPSLAGTDASSHLGGFTSRAMDRVQRLRQPLSPTSALPASPGPSPLSSLYDELLCFLWVPASPRTSLCSIQLTVPVASFLWSHYQTWHLPDSKILDKSSCQNPLIWQILNQSYMSEVCA